MSSLYEIASEYRADLAALSDLDLDPQTVADTLEGMQGDIRAKLRAVIAWGLDQSVLAAGTAEAAKRMTDLARSRESRAKTVLDYARETMQATGIVELATDEWGAKIAKTPASVKIAEGVELPAEFVRTKTTTEPDKTALKAALTAGRDVAGVSLVAGYRLAIR